jgi:hypothetical protein
MITEDKLAAASIAKIFGSELLKVQTNAVTDSGNRPEIVKMHPKQFLVNDAPSQARIKTHEQARILESLQREAEMAHPLPAQTLNEEPPVKQRSTPIIETEQVLLQQQTLQRIEGHLEKLVNLVENFLKSPKIKK